MLRQATVLLLLLSVSFVLAPLGTLHAHLPGNHGPHEHVMVHGGHVHEPPHYTNDGDIHDAGQTVDVNFAIADRSVAGVNWTHWLPLICGLAVIWLTVQYATLILRPPKADARPRIRFTYWRPPLRGPPIRSI